ncbi:MAG: FAD:protein FMN transferase [Kiritimatiellia bacterium]
MGKIFQAVLIGLGLAALVLVACCRAAAPRIVRTQWPVMGTVAALSLRGGEDRDGKLQSAVNAIYRHLESRLSAWNPDSELSRLARTDSTNWLDAVSADVRPCYDAAFALAERSGRAFNPAVGAKLRALGVSGGGAYSDVDLGAIAKGFAVDRAAGFLERHPETAPSSLVDLGGTLRVVGPASWRTGIRNPFGADCAAVIVLTNGESAATSGNYERFIERDGIRYSHILDGRTGEPTHGVAGVTVVTPRELGATLADGLSTTLFVLGPQAGAAFLERWYPAALALWIPDTPESPEILATPGMARRLADSRWAVRPAR